MTRTPDRLSLASLVAPMTREQFLAEHWEERHLVVRGAADRFGAPFSFADVDRYLAAAAASGSAKLSMGQAGKGIRTYSIRDLDPGRVYAAVGAGNTVMLAAIDRYWPAAAELTSALGADLNARVKVNVYMTPAGFQGAPIHPDIQDVFVLQLEGSKDWYVYDQRIYEPVETLEHIDLLAPPHVHYEEEPPLAERTTLEPGDLLYLPRGVAHRAVAPPDSPSLHWTVCVTSTYWVDVIKAAVEQVSAEHPELARSLRPGYDRDPAVREAMKKAFDSAVALVAQKASFGTTAELLSRAGQRAESFPVDGHFDQLLHLDEIGLDHRLVRREGLGCRVESSGESVYLCFASGRVKAAAALAPVLEFVRDHPSFAVRDLPEPLSDDSRVVLARRLVREGLLRADGRDGDLAEGSA